MYIQLLLIFISFSQEYSNHVRLIQTVDVIIKGSGCPFEISHATIERKQQINQNNPNSLSIVVRFKQTASKDYSLYNPNHFNKIRLSKKCICYKVFQ